MRIKNLLLGDMRFQMKYGFYALYVFITIVYIGIISILPAVWRTEAVVLTLFSDPAALGIFFIGAIILFEKSERVINYLCVSPVKVNEYVLSKLASLSVISTVVGLTISVACAPVTNPVLLSLGLVLGSVFFTLLGIIVASKISTLNQFLVFTIPVEIFICTPAVIVYFLGKTNLLLLLHPGVIVIRLIAQNAQFCLPLILLLCLWIILFYYLANRCVQRMLKEMGGVKL